VIPRTFVAGLHLRWDGVRQRPHHLLSRLALRVPVVVVEEPFAAGEDRDEVRRDGDVTIVRPLRRRGWSPPWLDEHTIATARRHAGEAPVGVWLSTPIMLPLADAFDAQPLVYDIMDELANFDIVPAGLVDAERETLARAQVVFTGGRSLYASRAGLGDKVRCEPSGVEFERFAADVAPHPLPSQLRGPVFGYVGVIDERLDVGLIETLADAFPDGHIVLVGPVFKLDPARLPRRANVHLTGPVPYDALPSWLAGFDVALMPFAQNRATASISPTKTLEYFAARKPVVSTPIADVAAEFSDAAFIAEGPNAFVDAVRLALDPPPARIARGLDYARARTWDAIAARMIDVVAAL
jgi:glycosyltransferase involved in cell wall biosynthesis